MFRLFRYLRIFSICWQWQAPCFRLCLALWSYDPSCTKLQHGLQQLCPAPGTEAHQLHSTSLHVTSCRLILNYTSLPLPVSQHHYHHYHFHIITDLQRKKHVQNVLPLAQNLPRWSDRRVSGDSGDPTGRCSETTNSHSKTLTLLPLAKGRLEMAGNIWQCWSKKQPVPSQLISTNSFHPYMIYNWL